MGSAAITVVANSPPSSGTLRITPSVGYALEDKFSVLANNWVDEDLPLKYTFKYIKGSTYSGGTEIALGASTPDALFATQLGLGGGDNNTITIVAYVQDSLGATTRVTQEIQVSQLVVAAKNQAAYLANKTSAVLAEASSGDPSTVLNAIMLTPATTKAVGNTISNLLDVDNSGSSKKLDEPMTVTCNGTTYSGEAVCPCTHLTDFSTEVTQSLSLVTEHFMNVVTHEVIAKDVKQNLLLILVMAAFFFFYVVAVFYVNRWDRRDHRKTTRASRQIKRGSATPEMVKLSSLFQEPEYLQAKSWHSKLRAVVVGFGRSLKQNHKLLSIVFKYNESFSRAQRLTIVFTLVATQMFTNALLYRLRKGPKSLGSACVSALITTVCMFPVGFLFMMMYKKAGRMQNYLIRFQVEDDAGNVVEVETDAYGNAREYSPAEQLSMDLATLARGVDMQALHRVVNKVQQPVLQREDGTYRDRLTSRTGQVCRGIFLALYNRDTDEKPPEHHKGKEFDDPLADVLVHIKLSVLEQKAHGNSVGEHHRMSALSVLPFSGVKRGSTPDNEAAGTIAALAPKVNVPMMPPAAPVLLSPTVNLLRIEESQEEDEESMDPQVRRTLALGQIFTMLSRHGGKALINSMLKFDPLLVSAASAAKIAEICGRLNALEEEEEAEEDDDDDDDATETNQTRSQAQEEDGTLAVVLALQAWLFKCDECCEAQESNARVVVAKAQAELLSTESQLKKLRAAIDNQFDRRISEAMAVEINGPNVNDIIVKSRQSVRRVSRRPTSVIKAEQMVREDKRRITVTIKKEKQAILRTNQEKLVEKRKAIKKAKKSAAIEQHRLRWEARLEQRKLLEGLRGIARLKKRLQLYLTAREERKVAALPLHERQVYLAEREQLKKIRRTSRILYNAFLRRQPAHQSKPIFPEWVLFISYTVSAIWSAWCIYFVLMFAFTVGRVEAQLWVTSLLSGLALTYVIADPLKLFFRMGLMPMIATGILANSGFFNALTSEPMALGAVVVAAGAGGMASLVAKHRADRSVRRNQRRFTKAAKRLVPVATAADACDVIGTNDIPEKGVVEEVEVVGRVEPYDSRGDSDSDPEPPGKNAFTDLSKFGVRDSIFNEGAKSLREELPQLVVKKGPPVQMLRSSVVEAKSGPPLIAARAESPDLPALSGLL
ncbi:hypothetical protein BBJ29_007665 [Phytophthora kernoviae]|uniref:REJ domain-containing protein n=1 Tax=Phytophthora kernoviae TaxID=325452 RepID=A0A3F2RHL3_9STRA|nr:hypothetical protein BBP00_00007632 [Phytophthora kernoviae]RLN62761.1 hypothetical protein BBJ29_007665 [Phytophthora kernoviae]